ncbi:MAG: iron-containing alcohol dehydrogenase family protein [Eubacteriales bacterium]|nr:iron-containing alcohol dehydrogenase family protein [Eubacteriales bacterium]
MSHYSLYLPNYSIGTDCYSEIPHVARNYGRTAVVVGGKTAMSKAKPALLKAVEGSDLTITDFIWYGGDSSYENGDALIANDTVRSADILFGVGGGRACDTAKYVADKLDKPLFTFPTLASNCAAVTAICVMYNADGTFRDYYYPKLAEHTFINSDIIADSPEKLLWAGIGDALSKECEAVFSSRDDVLSHTPLMGVQLSRICTTPLIENGAAAMELIRQSRSGRALDEVTLDIIISTGLVSNMTTHEPEYYYNSSLAHCVYYGSTVTQNGHKHLHGEVVSLGVLCLLTFDKNYAERDRIMKFNYSLGLPVCFDDVEISEDEFDKMLDKAVTTTEWSHLPKGVTREGYKAAMKEQNEAGRTFKASKKA